MQFEDCVYSENRISGSIDISDEVARHRSLMTDAAVLSGIWKCIRRLPVIPAILPMLFTRFMPWKVSGMGRYPYLFRGTVILNGVTYEVTRDILRLCGQTLGPQLQPTLAAICFRPPDQ